MLRTSVVATLACLTFVLSVPVYGSPPSFSDKFKKSESSSENTESSSQTSTLKAKLETEEKKEDERKWFFTHWIESSVGFDQLSEGTGEWLHEHSPIVSYDMGNWGLSVIQRFTTDWNFQDSAVKFRLLDTEISIGTNDLYSWGENTITGVAGILLPFGEGSREDESYGSIGIKLEGFFPVTSWLEFFVLTEHNYTFHSKRSLTRFDRLGRILSKPQPMTYHWMQNEVGLDIYLKKDKTMMIEKAVGIETSFRYDDPGVGEPGKTDNMLYWYAGLGTHIGWYSILIALAQEYNFSNEEPFSFLQVNQTGIMTKMIFWL